MNFKVKNDLVANALVNVGDKRVCGIKMQFYKIFFTLKSKYLFISNKHFNV